MPVAVQAYTYGPRNTGSSGTSWDIPSILHDNSEGGPGRVLVVFAFGYRGTGRTMSTSGLYAFAVGGAPMVKISPSIVMGGGSGPSDANASFLEVWKLVNPPINPIIDDGVLTASGGSTSPYYTIAAVTLTNAADVEWLGRRR